VTIRHLPAGIRVYAYDQWLIIQGRDPAVLRAGALVQQAQRGGCLPVRLLVSGA
jgi:hypothetical protein